MNLKKINSFTDYIDIIDRYSRKDCLKNDYIQGIAANLIINNALYSYCSENNAFLFVKKNVGMRMYYYINDVNEKADFSDLGDLVVEILFRNDLPQEEIKYLLSIGFIVNIQRDLYLGVYSNIKLTNEDDDIAIDISDNLEEIEKCAELFNTTFDNLSGEYVTLEECKTILEKRQILVARDSKGTILGAFHFSIDKGVVWGRHLAVFPDAQGKRVGKKLLNKLVEHTHINEKTRYMWWVQNQNKAAINLYEKAGFTYMHKSTISLIKQ